ncbi:MAG: hypothetical protein BIFFINMI_01092 [Phycisphaerae bacterium]|nr:hypothetical protein [Phycisphaerae bacterium]
MRTGWAIAALTAIALAVGCQAPEPYSPEMGQARQVLPESAYVENTQVASHQGFTYAKGHSADAWVEDLHEASATTQPDRAATAQTRSVGSSVKIESAGGTATVKSASPGIQAGTLKHDGK